jgi:lipoprotein NlpD
MFYNGISVGVSKETTIVAAAEGYVIFSATLKDYGETVIIRHDAQYATVYTHLTKSFVKPDQKIKQGDPIALVSPSQGSSSFAFEIRHKNKAQDPIPLLSP